MPSATTIDFKKVLGDLNIVRVICVDDLYEARVDVEEILAWASIDANQKAVRGLLTKLGLVLEPTSETFSAELRTKLEADPTFALRLQEGIANSQLKNMPAEQAGTHVEQLAIDRSVLGNLDKLLSGFGDFRRLTPGDWVSHRDVLVSELATSATLMIFDEFLGDRYEKGSDYLRSVAEADTTEKATLVLLSYTILSGQEHELTRQLQLDGKSVTAIAKRDLNTTDGAQQLESKLRASVLWRQSREIRDKCQEALTKASTEAVKRIGELTPLEFDEIVFESSRCEGAHEMDTLIRIYGGAFASSLRESLRSSEDAIRDLGLLRALRSDSPQARSPGSMAWKLQREEYFLSAEYVNFCRLPTDSGDIYLLTDTHGREHEYVLVGPPCDLMVRPTKHGRKAGIERALLCSLTATEPAPNQVLGKYELACYSSVDGKSKWVDVTSPVPLDLVYLDLCALTESGRARRTIGEQVPEHLSEGWKAYCIKYIDAFCRQWAEKWEAWQNLDVDCKWSPGVTPAYSPTLGSRLEISVAVETTNYIATIEFGIQRIGRLTPLLQGELIRTYSDYFARFARPHPLSKP